MGKAQWETKIVVCIVHHVETRFFLLYYLIIWYTTQFDTTPHCFYFGLPIPRILVHIQLCLCCCFKVLGLPALKTGLHYTQCDVSLDITGERGERVYALAVVGLPLYRPEGFLLYQLVVWFVSPPVWSAKVSIPSVTSTNSGHPPSSWTCVQSSWFKPILFCFTTRRDHIAQLYLSYLHYILIYTSKSCLSTISWSVIFFGNGQNCAAKYCHTCIIVRIIISTQQDPRDIAFSLHYDNH